MAEYFEWLRKGDVAVSTAIQENFGISAVEAMRMGCAPLLPNRLAYPEREAFLSPVSSVKKRPVSFFRKETGHF